MAPRSVVGRALLRPFLIFVTLALALGVPFLIWGDSLEGKLSGPGARTWLESYGTYAWAAGIGLLIADLAIPVPTTAVMAALGIVYGPILGGLVATTGSIASGLIGYGLSRQFGRPLVLRLLGPQSLSEGDRLFAGTGGWMVALSRWLPVVSEVVACMAGLARMPPRMFLAALVCGSAPLGFVFASIGKAGAESPLLTLGISALAPFALWALVRPFIR